jgi:hypothetical protein
MSEDPGECLMLGDLLTSETLWHWLRRLGLALLLGLILLLATAAPAWASVHTYHEQPGQTTYRSRQSLRDHRDLAWQATVFKRYRGQDIQGIYLRLVGFPGQVTVDRQGGLTIETGTTAQWVAPYALDPQTPASVLPENVSQYDMAKVLGDLSRPIPLTLAVPLVGQPPARLVVAPYVVEEWLTIAHTLPTDPDL